MLAGMDGPELLIRVFGILTNDLLLTIVAFIALCVCPPWFRGGVACGGPASSPAADVSIHQHCHRAKPHMHPLPVADGRIHHWLCAGLGQSQP